jgi:hypothetical protein
LKDVLQCQIGVSGRSLPAATLKSKGIMQEQASERADEVIGEIQPVSHYVINDPNVFAINPLLIVDAANLSTSQASQSWAAMGAGLQAIVLTARSEAGYAQTLHGPTFGTRGTVFGRLIFQRSFQGCVCPGCAEALRVRISPACCTALASEKVTAHL